MNVIMRLPFPWVTGNHANKLTRYRAKPYVTKKAKSYKYAVKHIIKAWLVNNDTIDKPFNLSIWVSPPDKRRRDKDNLEKVLQDALTDAGFWSDDSLIQTKVHYAWNGVVKGKSYVIILISDPTPQKPPGVA